MNNSSALSTIFSGFKFGMTLQFAIGPVSLFLFQAAAMLGFVKIFPSVFAVVLVDGVCIMLAILGIGALMQKSARFRHGMKYVGAFVLVVFAIFMIMTAFSEKASNALNIDNLSAFRLFMLTVIMTASSPVTLIFWAGVFSLKVAENPSITYNLMFGAGALISTVVFLSAFIGASSFAGKFLSPAVLTYLNVAVGCYLIYVALKTVTRKD